MHVIITGTIGSGKSTVAAQLCKALPQYKLLDFDKEVDGLYRDDHFLAFLDKEFGTTDRKQVSDIVFAQPELRRQLEARSIPALQERLTDALQAHPNLLIEFPLYFEAAWPLGHVDLCVTVHCDQETQVKRVAARDKASAGKIAAIRAAQLSTAAKVALADQAVDTGRDDVPEQLARLVEAIRIGDLRDRALCDLGVADAWPELVAAYSQPHRRYHTLAHLHAMFERLDQVGSNVSHPKALALAIWFHDYVYEVDDRYGDNEARSVKAMSDVLRRSGSPLLYEHEQRSSVVALAAEFILATKGHQPASGYLQSRPAALADAQLFLDIDLTILGKGPAAAEQFDQAIRHEFSRYGDQEFARGRVQALTTFLERDQVYFTPTFAHLEEAARANLNSLICRWKSVAPAQ
ncbi:MULTISPECIES: dephospho-CoA kinase [unclassified Variovorax]|uniref:dephospho-CoA kinase n=1 Tax=unclassified Variovorax TaxID=663243 RepID=UPI00076CEBF7|nr:MULTISPECIES: dephospho-CoA kinase [unclassified Variovorax]KWT98082.1 hypothetical protein APY03_0753 [Variovorax sp. WDL1]PNG50444.1 Dephospho-CoA kinase [Variovorax sp. B2]PNG51317.1 Dephospho-CoA kinase [Variovorax sp. B4]VTU43278.1 Dephospho-CoA kinase [Variovorax sp. PBL-H6]VTU43320.1 Dephospho-CoA kinase [Variovorax sp. SRS16]